MRQCIRDVFSIIFCLRSLNTVHSKDLHRNLVGVKQGEVRCHLMGTDFSRIFL